MPTMYVPGDASADLARTARGLADVFGFRSVENVAPVLAQGELVLLMGWRDFYCRAIGAFPGGCRLYWPHGWQASDSRLDAAALSTVLRHGDRAPILWAAGGDVLPRGARWLPPVWMPRTTPQAAPGDSKRPMAIIGDVWGASGPTDAHGDGFLASLAAVLGAKRIPIVAKSLIAPGLRKLAPGIHERAQTAREMLAGKPHAIIEPGSAIPAAAPVVHLGARDWWPWHLVDAIESGHAVEAYAWIVHRHRLQREDVATGAPRDFIAALEDVRAEFVARAAETLTAAGFAVEQAIP